MAFVDNTPKYIVLYSTSDCNHRCSHCFVDHNLTWAADELCRIASILSQKCLVHINGAEPLLHLDLLQAYKVVGQKFIFTNGLVFTGERRFAVIEELKTCGITDIRLSHHFQAVESLNAVPQETVERVTRYLLSQGFNVHYNTTVTVDNYLFLDENCERAFKLGVNRIKFFPLLGLGRAKQIAPNLGLSPSQMKAFYELVCLQREKYSYDELAIKVSGDFSGISPRFKCNYGEHSYAITPDMSVYGCVFAISTHKPIGHLLNDGKIIIEHSFSHDGSRCFLNCPIT